MKMCQIDGCSEPKSAKSKCTSHYNLDWRLKNKEKKRQQDAEYYSRNRQKILKLCKVYREENKEKRIPQMLKWHKENPERVREIKRAWDKRNKKEKYKKARYYASNRRARKIQATPRWLTEKDEMWMKSFYYNRPEGYHVDHIYPLNSDWVCGLHVPKNLQYLTASENCRKNNKRIGGN